LKEPYHSDPAWQQVERIDLDRTTEEAAGRFGGRVASLDAAAVIDLTCYLPESASQLATALRRAGTHLLHCGTIWVHGHSVEVPTTEEEPRRPFGDYGIRKAAIEAYLLREAAIPVTILHPGHLVGPGWAPINPAGNFNTEVFSALIAGRKLRLPNLGMETLHHVHADDVAQCFALALEHPSAAVGQSFHVVSAAALTLRGYAERVSEWFGQIAHLEFLPWEEWRRDVSEKDAAFTWDHIAHSPNCSIAKAQRLLGYEPCYSSLQAVRESLDWLMKQGLVA
jgi:nucleoside-diphosphate-sugar epimerase